MRLLPPGFAVATAFVCTVLLVPAADASMVPSFAPVAQAHRHPKHPPVRASITFAKNQRHPFRSRIIWRVYEHVDRATITRPGAHRHRSPKPHSCVVVAAKRPVLRSKRHKCVASARNKAHRHVTTAQVRRHHVKAHVRVKAHHQAHHLVWHLVATKSWRAGSGLGGRRGTDGCVRSVGWAPNGLYRPVQHDNYGGTYIKGRVFYLGAHTCRDGTLRQNMFIHSEAGAGNTQCHNGPGDQHCRWETPVYNDYRSNGCIKMAPGDLRQLVRRYHWYFRPGVSYDVRRFHVRVVS